MRTAGLAAFGLLLLTTTACGTSTDAPDSNLPDGGVLADTGPIACDTTQDCPSGQKCLFWGGYCTRGRCEAECPTVFDAAFYLVCDCATSQWRSSGCTDYPWSHTGATTTGPDGGLRTLQPGEPCTPMHLDASTPD